MKQVRTRLPPDGAVPPNWSRPILRARLSLFWEALWPPLAAFLCVAGLLLAATWSGVLVATPFGLRMAILAGFAAAALWALHPLARVRFPGRAEALARLDRQSRRPHRLIASIADRPAGQPGWQTDAIWQAHRTRMLARLGQIRAGAPRPALARRDPFALRALVLLLAVAAFVAAGDQRLSRLAALIEPDKAAAAPDARLDAWISPPAYTGRPPVLLTADMTGPIEVPENSAFILRSDREGIAVHFAPEGSDSTEPLVPPADGPGGEFGRELTGNGTMVVTADGDVLHRWPLTVIDDRPPTIALSEPPSVAPTGALQLLYEIGDDYGVTRAEARFVPAEGTVRAGAKPLIPPPDIDLTLPVVGAREAKGRTLRDMRSHPWAGSKVRMTLAASDAAGQEGFSDTVELTLPERAFSRPLARALVEMRRRLALDGESAEWVARALDALTIAPEQHIESASVYLGLRTAYWQVVNARTDDDLRGAVDYLWQVALGIEDGAMSLAAQNLRDIQQRLQQALENGAGDDEIRALMDELRQAMSEFFAEMARQAGNMDNLPELTPEEMERALSSRDLDQLMDQIENLARSGARDAARELLSQLQSMLDNMRMGRMQQQNGQAQQDMAQTLEELGEMMRQQQQLMDETFRFDNDGRQPGPMSRGQNGQLDRNGSRQGSRQGQGQDGSEPGAQGNHSAEELQALRDRQQALRDALADLMARMRERGQNPDGSMGEAGEAMGDAEGAIGEGQLGDAVGDQGRALESLRQGAQQLVDQMGSQMAQGSQSGMGRGQTDPLGRPQSQRGQDLGLGVKTPEVFDVEQARRILEELRRRLSDPTRPSPERNYLERLLEGF